MKKILLSAMLGLLVIGTVAPISASAISGENWGCSLNPAIARNSDGENRSSSTLISNDDWDYLNNQTMTKNHDYYLFCKNSKATASWVWADGEYDWNS